MEQIAKFINFLESYPSWVKYLVVGLIITITLLLIVFRPSKVVRSQWKVRVYDFRNFGDLAKARNVGERISGRILDDLIRRQLQAKRVQGHAPTGIIATRDSSPANPMEAYRELAPFVEVVGVVDEASVGGYNLEVRVSRINSNLEIESLLNKTYSLPKQESNWEAVAHSIGEEIFELLSQVPQDK